MNRKFKKQSDTFGSTTEDLVEQQSNLHFQQSNLHFQKSNLHFQKSNLHLQLSGLAHYDDHDKFLFTPDNSVVGSLPSFRGRGIAQLMSDGTFDFIRQPHLRAQSQLIRKLAHGRVSKTKDGAIQLTLKVFCDEGVNISETIATEAELARQAIVEWQLKR